MDLTYRYDYWDDHELKAEFIRFLIEIHGLDLSLWDRLGYWDRCYWPFSFFDDGRLIASLCVYSMDMTIDGKRTQVAQISGVGTAEEYRRKGLNSELTRRALECVRSDHDFFFLFADDEARLFYKAGGFRAVPEYRVSYPIPELSLCSGIRKLDIENKNDRELIERLARDRVPVSSQLGVRNYKLFMFWCLYFLKDNLFYIDELDTLVLYGRKSGKVTLYDVVGNDIPLFSDFYPYIGKADDRTVEFMFMVDKMGLDERKQTATKVDNGTHLLGEFPLEQRDFLFPHTAHA